MIDAVATDPSSTPSNEKPRRARRTRMTGAERRAQLLEVGRTLFATKGFEATSVEEIAAKAGVSSRWSTSTSAARRGCTRWWWTARCAACWTW